MVKKDSWVTLKRTVLEANERAAGIPADTAATPLRLWVRGWLLEDAEIGASARVRTRTGRTEEGVLEEESPVFDIGYGNYIPELSQIGEQAREILFGGGGGEG